MWTKSQKFSGAVLGLAVAAFGIDRFVLSAGDAVPEDSAAEFAVVQPQAAPPTAGTKPAAAAPTALTTVTLARRLASFAESRKLAYVAMGDAFRPSDKWVALSAPPPPPPAPPKITMKASTAAQAPKINHAEVFLKRHALTAVMKKRGGGMAIVDGKLYAAGQTIDGFKLTSIGLTDATFVGKGTKVTLKLPSRTAVTDAR